MKGVEIVALMGKCDDEFTCFSKGDICRAAVLIKQVATANTQFSFE